MRRILLEEYQTRVEFLTASEVGELTSNTAEVRVSATKARGLYELTASSVVGTQRLGSIELVIRPKIPLPNLLHLLGSSPVPPSFREPVAQGDAPDELAAALGYAYLNALSTALSKGGPESAYEERREPRNSIRGRIDWISLELRQFGLMPPIPLEFTELSEDNEVNRRLVYAAALLERVLPPATAALLRRERRHFTEALGPPQLPLHVSATGLLSRRSERFRTALALAEVALRGMLPALEGSHGHGLGFLVDMNVLFEQYVLEELAREIAALGRFLVTKPSGLFLDEENRISITPDAVITNELGTCLAVVDVKYKETFVGKSPDLYQAVSYCTALKVSRGVLLYASAASTHHTIRGDAGISVDIVSLDLSDTLANARKRIGVVAASLVAATMARHEAAPIATRISGDKTQ